MLDDLIQLKPTAKLIAQFITASLLFFILDIRITSFYDFSDSQFSPIISYLTTVIMVIIITNALNLIDGIDGLAAAFSLVACLFFGGWFAFTNFDSYAFVCLALAGGILAFLFQNWAPSNIFMGDTGSLVIGTILSLTMIRFLNENHNLNSQHAFKFDAAIGTAICVMIIPLVDTTRIILLRVSKGISPFTADKRHIHHALIRLGYTHQKAVYILTFIHVTMIMVAILLRNTGPYLLPGLVLVVSTGLCLLLHRALRRVVRDDVTIKGSDAA